MYYKKQKKNFLFQASSISHKDAISKIKADNFDSEQYENKYIHVTKGKQKDIFDNEVYYKRICVIAETSLVEAEYRAMECGKYAFLNIIGCGMLIKTTIFLLNLN